MNCFILVFGVKFIGIMLLFILVNKFVLCLIKIDVVMVFFLWIVLCSGLFLFRDCLFIFVLCLSSNLIFLVLFFVVVLWRSEMLYLFNLFMFLIFLIVFVIVVFGVLGMWVCLFVYSVGDEYCCGWYSLFVFCLWFGWFLGIVERFMEDVCNWFWNKLFVFELLFFVVVVIVFFFLKLNILLLEFVDVEL